LPAGRPVSDLAFDPGGPLWDRAALRTLCDA